MTDRAARLRMMMINVDTSVATDAVEHPVVTMVTIPSHDNAGRISAINFGIGFNSGLIYSIAIQYSCILL